MALSGEILVVLIGLCVRDGWPFQSTLPALAATPLQRTKLNGHCWRPCARTSSVGAVIASIAPWKALTNHAYYAIITTLNSTWFALMLKVKEDGVCALNQVAAA